ncbi:hypothetical protein H310_10686 [Aphanomyces invadans]|uniref:WW domain-containing protein n=1 Tax=Aphanomyces invadans TaxID=157072 RepID=A0A024TPU1_9STRA|nr:hypothetical protein H310_10686 [Aphanomyces invadans]ETV96038.1 hypothetical protein H310_10686 [Aphanomyces invadans]|eukprot:XP_008875349.1 hypothetical protein H310_10686 [Aphanomyces invadans]
MSVTKKGIWTEHVDAASGRTYYFNVVHGRSYWELTEDLRAVVMRPLREAVVAEDDDPAEDETATQHTHEEPTSSDGPSRAAALATYVNLHAADSFSNRIQMAMKHQEEQRRREQE